MTTNITEFGSCQCGGLQIAVKTKALTPYVCHCLECKKQSASSFAISIPLASKDLVIKGSLKVYRRPAHSGATTSCYFCSSCGTRIYHQSSSSDDRVTLKAGILDCVETLTPIAHLWVKRKADWIELDASVETFEEQPDDLKAWRDRMLSVT